MRIGADFLFFLRSLPSTPGSNGDAFDPKSNTLYPHTVLIQTALEYFSSHLMTLIYLAFTLLLTAKLTVGHSVVQCWVPQQFTKSWEEYTEQVCWMSPKTVWAAQEPWKSQLTTMSPKHAAEEERHANVNYYQWMPYCFLMVAVLHPLPSLLWRLLVSKDERYLNHVVQHIVTAKKEANEARREQLWQEVCHLSAHLFPQRKRGVAIYRQLFNLSPMHTPGLRFTLLPYKYLLYKAILITWFLLQCFFFCSLVRLPRGIFYGAHLMNFLWEYGDLAWKVSGLFPRIVRCDFQIHALGYDRMHSVQCSLPMNMLYEKMLVVAWCLLWTLSIAVGLSLVVFVVNNILGTFYGARSFHADNAKRHNLELHSLTPQQLRASARLVPRGWGERFVVEQIRASLMDNALVWEWWIRCEMMRHQHEEEPNNSRSAPSAPPTIRKGWGVPPANSKHAEAGDDTVDSNFHLV